MTNPRTLNANDVYTTTMFGVIYIYVEDKLVFRMPKHRVDLLDIPIQGLTNNHGEIWDVGELIDLANSKRVH